MRNSLKTLKKSLDDLDKARKAALMNEVNHCRKVTFVKHHVECFVQTYLR